MKGDIMAKRSEKMNARGLMGLAGKGVSSIPDRSGTVAYQNRKPGPMSIRNALVPGRISGGPGLTGAGMSGKGTASIFSKK